ncbi:MAG: hypothetical protein R2692_00970 [Microbacterium sp.]
MLSGIGQLFFRPNIGDFHCGLRGFNRDRIRDLDLQTTPAGVRLRDGRRAASLARYRSKRCPRR